MVCVYHSPDTGGSKSKDTEDSVRETQLRMGLEILSAIKDQGLWTGQCCSECSVSTSKPTKSRLTGTNVQSPDTSTANRISKTPRQLARLDMCQLSTLNLPGGYDDNPVGFGEDILARLGGPDEDLITRTNTVDRNIAAILLGLGQTYDIALWGYCHTIKDEKRECFKVSFGG